jgi:outer membrane protein assembly factor BamE (lipoprotein component of BamABCDE complex)
VKAHCIRQYLKVATSAAAAITIVVAAGACSPEARNHGSQLDEQRLDSVRVGAHTKDNVIAILGSPASTSTFDGDAWYYIGGERAIRTPFRDEEMERTVLVVRFGPSGVVSEVDVFGLERAREIEVVDRETPSSGQSVTVMQQLLGNIGRFESEGGSAPSN